MKTYDCTVHDCTVHDCTFASSILAISSRVFRVPSSSPLETKEVWWREGGRAEGGKRVWVEEGGYTVSVWVYNMSVQSIC
jgi:hypothetical protein